MLTAFTTLAGHTQLGPDLGKLGITIAASLTDLVISYLSTNTNVHILPLDGRQSKC